MKTDPSDTRERRSRPEVGHSGVELFLPAAEDEDEGALLDEALCSARPMPVAPPVITAVFPFSLSCHASFVGVVSIAARRHAVKKSRSVLSSRPQATAVARRDVRANPILAKWLNLASTPGLRSVREAVSSRG